MPLPSSSATRLAADSRWPAKAARGVNARVERAASTPAAPSMLQRRGDVGRAGELLGAGERQRRAAPSTPACR